MRLIIHLGIHKTASTFFQKKIFNNLNGYLYFNRNSLQKFKDYILYTDEFYFDKEIAFDFFSSAIDRREENIIISDEDFYGLPFSGGTNRKRNLDRLLETFKGKMDVKFIIFFREQDSLLNSLYLQYIKTGGTASPKSFMNSIKPPVFIQTSYFKYDKYIQYISNRIGEKSICYLFYEDFKVNKNSVISEIELFLETSSTNVQQSNKKSNHSINYRFTSTIRFLNKFTKSYKNPNGSFPHIFSKTYTKFFLILSKNMKSSKPLVQFNSSELQVFNASNMFLTKIKSKEWMLQNNYINEK